jgi:hypothetical protein
MKPLFFHFSPVLCFFFIVMSKYSSEHLFSNTSSSLTN